MSASKLSTYDLVGQVEDVSNVISDITPTETPFQTSIRKGKTRSMHPEWMEDELDDAADNANVEGADAPAANQTQPVMRSNRHQIFMKTVKVTGTSREVDLYGRDDELARQLAKKGKEIKRDLERALVGVVQTAVVGDDNTPRRLQSALSSIDSSVSENASSAALSETMVLNVMKKIYDVGSEVSTLMIKPGDALNVAGFAYRNAGSGAGYAPERYREMGEGSRKITNVVDVYASPWGQVTVKMNRWIKSDTALAYSPDMWTLLWLRKWFKKPLAITGDSESHLLIGECTLKNHNFQASGKIYGLT